MSEIQESQAFREILIPLLKEKCAGFASFDNCDVWLMQDNTIITVSDGSRRLRPTKTGTNLLVASTGGSRSVGGGLLVSFNITAKRVNLSEQLLPAWVVVEEGAEQAFLKLHSQKPGDWLKRKTFQCGEKVMVELVRKAHLKDNFRMSRPGSGAKEQNRD